MKARFVILESVIGSCCLLPVVLLHVLSGVISSLVYARCSCSIGGCKHRDLRQPQALNA